MSALATSVVVSRPSEHGLSLLQECRRRLAGIASARASHLTRGLLVRYGRSRAERVIQVRRLIARSVSGARRAAASRLESTYGRSSSAGSTFETSPSLWRPPRRNARREDGARAPCRTDEPA